MGEERDDSDANGQQRLDALRDLARQSAPATESPPAPLSPLSSPTVTHGDWRRWGASALVIVAAVLVVSTVVGSILQQSGVFQPSQPSPPPLSEGTMSIAPQANVYCPSSPAWSPDGKWLAVLGQTNTPTGACSMFDVNSIAQVSGGTTNAPSGYALVVLDSVSGRLLQRISLPDLTSDLLCHHLATCQGLSFGYQSVSWSPDGRTLAVFCPYTLYTGYDQPFNPMLFNNNPKYMQRSGALVVVRLENGATSRMVTAQEAPHDAMTNYEIPSSPRFIWNLATGAATVSNILKPDSDAVGLTTAYAPAYKWQPDGSIAALDTPVADTRDVALPWRQGTLGVTKHMSDPIRLLSSQWSWSPDGAFVTPNLETEAYMNLPGVIPYPTTPGFYTSPTVDSPSKAMTEVISASRGSGNAVEWAQSWDDALLASDSCAANGDGLLTIRALKSGQTLAHADYTYPLTSNSLGCAGDIGPLVWSPNSMRIASVDQQDDQIILWQTNVAH